MDLALFRSWAGCRACAAATSSAASKAHLVADQYPRGPGASVRGRHTWCRTALLARLPAVGGLDRAGVQDWTTLLGVVCVFFWLINATRQEDVAPGGPLRPPCRGCSFAASGCWRWWLWPSTLPGTISARPGCRCSWKSSTATRRSRRRRLILCYYIATDAGSLMLFGARRCAAGVVGSWQPDAGFHPRAGHEPQSCRGVAFGPGALGVLLLIGFSCAGLFPNYYSFTQELTVQHQGKLDGRLAAPAGCRWHSWSGL